MLSLNKLENLLAQKGFLAKKFFIIHGLCAYIEVISVVNADTFLLAIPSKYKFKMRPNDNNNAYKIRIIEMEDKHDTTEQYTGQPDENALEKAYTEIDTIVEHDFNHTDNNDMAEHLEEAYRRPIALKDINQEDTKEVRDVYRQLRRLKYCVQNLRYKLAILVKNYLCILRNDNIDCFIIKHFTSQSKRKLLVLIDLELFYEKMDNLAVDIVHVREGVFKVLDKNQDMHTRNLRKMMEERNDVIAISDDVHNKKVKYTGYIEKFQTLLNNTTQREKLLIEKAYKLNANYDASIKGVHQDTTIMHQKGKIEDELRRIEIVKQDILKNIITLNSTLEDMMLSIDKVFFDNTIMMDEIFKNFNRLRELQ